MLDLRTVDPATTPRSRRRSRARARGRPPMTVVVGTAGHIDHGKTTLLRALTGIDADRLPEERRRGMTIDVGYAHLALADGTRARLRRRARARPAGRQHARRARARSTPRCSSWPPTTGRAPRPSSTSRCSTRSGSRDGRRGRDQGRRRRTRARRPRSSTAVARLLARDVAGRRRRSLAVSSVDGAGLDALRAALVGAARSRSRGSRGRRAGAARASRSTGSSRSRAAASS